MSNKAQSQSMSMDKNLAPSQVPFFTDTRDNYFFYKHAPDGNLFYFNEMVSKVLGYSVDDCIENFFDYLTDSPINKGVKEHISLGVSGERLAPFEIEIYDLNQQVHRLEITMVPHFNETSQLQWVESVAHDISRLHYSLSGYKRKSILLDETEKIASMGTWDWNMVTDEVRWSPAFHKILGTDEQQVTPGIEAYIQYLNNGDREQLVARIVGAIKSNKTFEHFHRVCLKDGAVKYLESRGKTLVNAQGQAIRMIGTVHDVTSQIEAQSQIEKVYKLINSSVNEIYLFDMDNYQFSFVSEGACRNLGYTLTELARMTPFDLCPVIPKIQIIEMMSPVIEHPQEQVVFEAFHLRKNGTTYPVEVRLQLIENNPKPLYMAIALDISVKKQAQAQARDQAALLRSVIDATPDLIFFKDNQGVYLGCNKAFEKYLSLAEPLIVGHTDNELFNGAGKQVEQLTEGSVITNDSTVIRQEWVTYSSGDKALLETQLTPYYCENGNIEGVVGISRDVTEHWQYEKQLKDQKDAFEHSAHYDSLTNLPNRLLFKDRLGQSLNKARRNKEGLAIFFIDLDRFKPINDELGHAVGDKVLQAIAQRLTTCVREMDTVARLGGDEFTVIMEGAKQPQSAAILASKINREITRVINVGQHNLTVSASIGISLYPDDGDSIDELLQNADLAMYRVKEESRDAYGFHTENTNSVAFERTLMESQLRNALINDELCVYYQPQLSMCGNKITGVEALVRWDHPHLGMILPARFIPLAEDVGLIQAIDEWVLDAACKQVARWKKQGVNGLRVAVNLSVAELARDNLYDIVKQTLERNHCEPDWLALEVSEGGFIDRPEQAKTLLNRLSDLGIELVIHDFGTGYTSLSHLRKLPISKLKMDRSLINNVPQNKDDTAIAKAVLALGKSLGMQVIAQGVETREQHQLLVHECCDEVQGYLYSRPVNVGQMTSQLLQNGFSSKQNSA